MALEFEDLLAAVLQLTPEDRRRLLGSLPYAARNSAAERVAGVADSAPSYSTQFDNMTHVTVVLPDDLAQQAKDAGLLGGKALEEVLRRALQEHSVNTVDPAASRQRRKLVRENGYLVVEALPGEKPITTAEVRKALDDME